MGRLARAAQTFYKERLGTGSPPHPPQCAHWGTYGLWWLRLDLTEQSPGLFDPQGEGFGGMSLFWKLSFGKILSSIFSLENASQIGLSIPEEIVPLPYQK